MAVRSLIVLVLALSLVGPTQAAAAEDPAGEVLVLVAPSVLDAYYAPVFDQVIDYDVMVVDTIRRHTEVVLVVDRATLPYLSGRVPEENLLLGDVLDIWARDFSPVTGNRTAKFRFQPEYLSPRLGNRIDRSFVDLTDSIGIEFSATRLRLDGGNFVANGGGWAIVTDRVFTDNPNKTERKVERIIRRMTGAGAVAIIPAEPGDTTGHADGMVMWLDDDTLLVNQYDEPFRSEVLGPILDAFPDVEAIEIPVDYRDEEWQGFVSACGLHVNSLVTDNHVFLATYGQRNDKRVRKIIRRHTDKTIVPIDASSVCFMGGAVRCLTWHAVGDHAAAVLDAARS